MPKALQSALLSTRDLLVTYAPFLVLAGIVLYVAYRMLDPNPPRHVVLATGTPQGAYAEFGKRYADLLKAYGITVELRATQGAAENLALLRDPDSGVDIAFVQGGADRDAAPASVAGSKAAADSAAGSNESSATQGAANTAGQHGSALVSLGSMFYEPVWLFYREASARKLLKSPTLASLSQLPGWRVDIGAPGSGVPVLMGKLLEANRIDAGALTLQKQSQTPAVVDLLEGRSDALVFASAPESLLVQMLLQTPGIRLFDFAQAEAYSRRFPFMSPVVLPRGVVDLARDLPPSDVHLVAPTATLVAKARTHPALMQLFVQSAKTVHGEAGWFQRKGDFPNPANSELPLAREAQRFYQTGTPWLQRYLPFWLANLIDRMWPVLLSIVAVLIPLSRLLPPLYEMRVRSRIFRWYGRLREIEETLAGASADRQRLGAELDALDVKVERIAVPLSHADELYALRSHIDLVRKKLRTATS